ncbi:MULTISPECIES: hypothetical protein [Halomonadaceae]|uniref:DoxX protein n=1 Tax=Vreelandella halophila TaxID=86177 RepID=A0A9X5B3T6_9GAMM|nr:MULTISPECIES: hypothetical protein [Halomonas]MYL25840.1 hypothetical protein [Halomonas utahensis]MYL73598.1 hypothetical protein [Halomonas sp. 22501_18_FS]
MTESTAGRLPIALLALRLGVFIVMVMWTLDKLVQPEHTAGVFANFYGLSGLGPSIFMLLGVAQLVLVLAFVAGAFRRLTYGLIFLLHTVSTLSSWAQYLDAFNNLLFFAAWPMLAACFALYLLRDQDTLFSIDAARSAKR